MARSSQKAKVQEWPPWDFMPPPDDREWRTRNPEFVKYPLINEHLRLHGEIRQIRLYSPLRAKYRVVSLSSGQFADLSVDEIVAQCEDHETATMLAKKAQLQAKPHSRASCLHHSCSVTIPPEDSPEAVPSHTTKAMPRTGPAVHNITEHDPRSNDSSSKLLHGTQGTAKHNVVATTKCTESHTKHVDTNDSAQTVTPNAQKGLQRKRLMKQLEIKMLEHNQSETKKRRSLEKPIRVIGSRVVKGRKSVAFKV